MVRAVRFAARLGFTIEPATYEAILGHHEHLTLASAPRLLEEIYRLFPFGSGEAAFRLLFQTGLLRILMPELDAFLAGGTDGNRDLFWKHLAGLDRRDTGSGAAPDAALMFATLYFSRFLETIEEQQADFRVHAEIARSILQPVAERYHMPKRVFYQAIQILDNQRRFEAPGKRFSKSRFAEQATFPATLTLREIHLESLGQDLESLDSWKALRAEIEKAGRSRGDDDGKGDATRRRRPRRGGRRRGRRRGPPAAAGGATDG